MNKPLPEYDIVKENQEYSHKLQEESNRLEKEIQEEREVA